MIQTGSFSIAPNSSTDIDYPSGYTRFNTRVLSVVIAYYYFDYKNLTIELTTNKIRVYNGTSQNWADVKLILAKFN